ncbi:MAG: hypothetical protein ACQETJ_05640 [Bacteroidota bacterium]
MNFEKKLHSFLKNLTFAILILLLIFNHLVHRLQKTQKNGIKIFAGNKKGFTFAAAKDSEVHCRDWGSRQGASRGVFSEMKKGNLKRRENVKLKLGFME